MSLMLACEFVLYCAESLHGWKTCVMEGWSSLFCYLIMTFSWSIFTLFYTLGLWVAYSHAAFNLDLNAFASTYVHLKNFFQNIFYQSIDSK